MASLFPGKFAGWDLIVWLGMTCGMTVFLEQLGRDKGLEKEARLFKKWGGKPTTVMLRHRDSSLGPITLDRYHRKLSNLIQDISLPSPEEEKHDPEGADQIYDSCVDYLKTQTRDQERFRLVFTENVNYGFRRNLWGMKPIGLFLACFSIIIVLFQIHPNWANPGQVKPVVLVTLTLDVTFLLIWVLLITPAWVHTAAEAYARQLLSSCDRL